jgi:COP9 signalosome complex subunit 7
MQQLDIQTVRELEDFIISECFFLELVKGKLDQKQRCLQVSEVVTASLQEGKM